MPCPPFGHRPAALALVVARTKKLQIGRMIRATPSFRQNVANIHVPERKVGITTNANAFLLTIKAVAMGPVIGKGTKIGPGWWGVTLSSLPLPRCEDV
ncbi:MAG: hypothetical protein OXH65_03060 [Paracoccaceae bacterium]|nr:hypothetical protein [Paracoccaceae bacterium]